MSRLSKIARLPHAVRETLNLRLQDGESGPELLAWLNAEPTVQTVLAAHFDGQPVNAQNLSEWRRGGHVVWCQQQEVLALAERLQEHKAELAEVIDEDVLAESLFQSSLLMLCRELNATGRMGTEAERLRAVLAIISAFTRLQRTQRDLERVRRDYPSSAPSARRAKRNEEARQAQEVQSPAAAAMASRTPPPPASPEVSPDDDKKIAAVWASAMKLATGKPGKPASAAAAYMPKLPVLQAA